MTITVKNSRGRPAKWASALRLAPLAIVAFTLAGCKNDPTGTQVAGWALIDPEQRHPILVSQQPANLKLAIARGSQGLTPKQRSDVVDFVGHYHAGDSGNSRVVISAPAGSANESAALAAVGDVHQLLLSGGFPESAISVEAYQAEGSQPPLRVSYMRYIAEGPECGDNWSENLARNPTNIAHPNFGCAGQHNLAAMVVNPADLLGPRTMTPREADRRDVAYEKYIKGDSIKSSEEPKTIQGLNN